MLTSTRMSILIYIRSIRINKPIKSLIQNVNLHRRVDSQASQFNIKQKSRHPNWPITKSSSDYFNELF